MSTGDGVTKRGLVPVSVRGRCTLELICDFKKKWKIITEKQLSTPHSSRYSSTERFRCKGS